MNNLFVEFYISTSKKKNKVNLKNLVNIVNRIVKKLPVIKWGSHKRLHVDHIKIVTSKFAFHKKICIFGLC
jgi:hypothetical protein